MDQLGINGPLLIAFVINFLLLFGLLSVVLYKPVMKMLDERQAKIRESMEQAEAIKEQSERADRDIKAQLQSAQIEAQKIVAQAAQIGDKLKMEAKEEARLEAENMINKAKIEIERQREKDIQDLQKQFADIAILAAEKVIEETLDKDKHRKLIEEVITKDARFKQN
jgi:F-type H+-transporting ATPase subunit b